MTTSDQRLNPLVSGLAWMMVAGLFPSFEAGAADLGQSDAGFARAVTIIEATRSCFVQTLPVTGNVVPKAEVLVTAEREGQLSHVLVDAGDTVTSGQVLARVKPPEGQGTTSATDVQAPAAGLIYAVFATLGATVGPGSAPLFRIARDGDMELQGEIPVESMARLAPNQPVKVDVVGVGEIDGKIRSVSKMVNPVTQLGHVNVSIGYNPQVRVGVFARGTVELGRRCGPAVPLSAVLYGAGSPVVQVIRSERVETRVVQVGQIKGGEAEILEGLSEGESVVERAGAFVRDGDRVFPVRSPRV